MVFRKSLEETYKELRQDIKKFFAEHSVELILYGGASRRIKEKLREGSEDSSDFDEVSGILLNEIWALRDNYRKELSGLCGRHFEANEDRKMFGKAYGYLNRILDL